MEKFIRYWNKNRKDIIKIIAIIAFIIIIIQVINNLLKNNNNSTNINITNNTTATDIQKPTESILTGETLSEQVIENNTSIIENFVTYCNNKEIEKAYSLLSDDCKAEFNNNINLFVTNYYNKIFETQKTYGLELWITNLNTYTYKILYYEGDLLATGGNTMNNNIEDYITIINQNGESKININRFINKEIINKSQIVNDVEITVNSRKTYKDYETYNILVQNNTSKKILLSDSLNSNDICLLDKNEEEYLAFLSEFIIDDLYVGQNQKLNIDISFNKIYDLYREIEKVKFGNIILNAQEYMEDTENITKEQISITIGI